MARQEFKAESKRLLELMIGSIYTHKEIFLRELISNSSDALDKLYFRSLTDTAMGVSRSDLKISIEIDSENRILTIKDNGIGMTEQELVENLGTIARSGSNVFKQENEKVDDISIIGQFGVGFYSAFMVADKVTVTSRHFDSDQSFRWESDGVDGFTVEKSDERVNGTVIVLNIKPDTEDENYSEFLDAYRISALVKKYSDYIHYPIHMDMERSRKKDDSDEYETYTEDTVLNTMVPIWKKNKSEVTKEEYADYYKGKFYDFEEPTATIHSKTEGTITYDALMFIPARPPYDYYTKDFEKGLALYTNGVEEPTATIHSKTEGTITYDALMFIPARPPYDYYTKDFEKGLALYTNGVLIMEKCKELLPDYLAFVRGLVDSDDLSLNISRELLQQDRQLKMIAGSIEKKLLSELRSILKNDRDKYVKFWNSFGRQLKFGVYDGFGANKDKLADLLMFETSNGENLATLDEYIGRMREEQTEIYYATAESLTRCRSLPQTELLLEKGYEVLFFTQDIDEFAIKMLGTYKEKSFKSVQSGDLDISTDEDREKLDELAQRHSSVIDALKQALGETVSDVRLSKRLRSHAVCLTTEGEVSLEMEKILKTGGDTSVKASRVLEINPEHRILSVLEEMQRNNQTERIDTLAKVLYAQAMLIEGIIPENPAEYSAQVISLLDNI